MSKEQTLIKAFGMDDYYFANIIIKHSNVRISRIFNGQLMGCTFCFPHGYDNVNHRHTKDLKCWKRYRKHQWRN